MDQLFGPVACVDYLRMMRQALFAAEAEPEPARPHGTGDTRAEVVTAIVDACGELGSARRGGGETESRCVLRLFTGPLTES